MIRYVVIQWSKFCIYLYISVISVCATDIISEKRLLKFLGKTVENVMQTSSKSSK